MNANDRSGMTLVELLVVLAVLAAVAVSVAVSSSATVDRARFDETRRQGEAMRDALERADGLSVFSDLGQMFDTETVDEDVRSARNVVRLGYLFSRSNAFEITVGEGTEATVSAAFKTIPAYDVHECELLPTNFAAVAGIPAGLAAKFASVTNGLGGVSLGCGWRGPYCSERVRGDDGLLRDGFGGLWECAVSPTNCLLVSRGRDRAADGLDAAKDWQDRDMLFEVRTGAGLVSLAVSLDEDDSFAVSNLYVFAYAPKLAIDETADEMAKIGIVAQCRVFRNAASGTLTGLTAGERVFFVVGEDGESRFCAARPQRTILRHGVNELLKLKIATRSE